MHLAFIGLCPETRELAIAANALGHRITWFAASEHRPDVTALFSDAQIHLQPQQEWESLLDGVGVDGVVLAAAADHEVDFRSDQWRRLTQAGARILMVYPLVSSLLVYLEADMLARYSGTLLLPYWPELHSSSVAEVREIASDNREEPGRLEQAVFRRLLSDRSPQSVVRWFARDVVLLDYLAGPFAAITAVGPDASNATYANLGVHLHGLADLPVRWEVTRPHEKEQGTLSVRGAMTDRRLVFAASASPIDHIPEVAPGDEMPPSPEALAGIEAFQDAIQGGSPPLEDWLRTVRAMELADSIEISLRRGRRIDVHYRQMTEETSYKGMMSAAGCGLLLLGLVILIFAGMLNAVFGWRLTRFWYVPVLFLFVAFLALQIIARLLVRKSDRRCSTRAG